MSATLTVPALPDFLAIVHAYNDVAERLKQSHELLRTEVHRLKEELRRKNEELQRSERLAALGEMAAGLAHEIRNPLGGIGLYASLLERDLSEHPKQLHWVRRIRVGVGNLEQVVGDILAFAGKAPPRFEDVSLACVLDSVLTHCAPQTRAFAATISVGAELGRLRLQADPCQLERALLNLVFNALDASGKDGSIWIRAAKRDGEEGLVSIAIEDNGPGVDPAVQPRIFDPFFTTKHTGTGLGLAIVHRIVEAHGGLIKVRNRPEGGACFIVSLPGRECDSQNCALGAESSGRDI